MVSLFMFIRPSYLGKVNFVNYRRKSKLLKTKQFENCNAEINFY